jgi:hypothetical protein
MCSSVIRNTVIRNTVLRSRATRSTVTTRRVRRSFVAVAVAILAAVVAPSGVAAASSTSTTPSAGAVEPMSTNVLSGQPPVLDPATPPPASGEATAEQQRTERLVTPAQRARTSWEGHRRPAKLIILRPRVVDIVTNGLLTQRAVRMGGVLSLAQLDRYLPSTWLTIEGGVARLSAAIVLTAGVALDVGGDVTTLQLAGGATAPEAASIYTGGGRLSVHGVIVTSAELVSQQPVPAGAGRPFIVVAPGGRLDTIDVTFSDLGTPVDDPEERAGVVFGKGSSGSLVRTSLLRNSTGLKLDGSVDVHLDDVTIGESATDGLVLRGDRGTTMIGVRTERNAVNGVLVTGPSTDRPVTGLTTTGNGEYGVAVVGQIAPQIRGVVTQRNIGGGLRLAGSMDVTVSDVTATDEPIGVVTHLTSSRVVLDQLRIVGGRRGVMIEKTTTGLELTGTRIERAEVGVSIGGRDIKLRQVRVKDSGSGVRVERGAAGVTATGLTLSGGQDGFVAIAGTAGVVLRDVVADGVANNAVRTFSANMQIIGGRIIGSTTGIDAHTTTTIAGTAISQVDVGIRARSTGLVAAEDVDVSAVSSGIDVEDGSSFILADSRVKALEAVNGRVDLEGLNDLSLPPLNVLGAIGVPLLLLALVLDQVQTFRQRSAASESRQLPPSMQPVSAEARQ